MIPTLINDQNQPVYAVAIATGISQESGNKYANVQVSMDENAKRSPYSIYLDTSDEDMMSLLGNPELTYSEERKVMRLEQPVKLKGLYKLYDLSHAPYKTAAGRVIWGTSVVVRPDDNESLVINSAIQRAYMRAESFFKGEKFLKDYKTYVLFDLSREELEDLLTEPKEDLGE
jgi:hypothetical protein